jgi:hypothetical protein
MEMPALSVMRSAAYFDELMTDFPVEVELKIQVQRASMAAFAAFCSSSRSQSANLFSLWKQFADDQSLRRNPSAFRLP